jgi:alpha-ketoglutarate-dependent taurine dioxygenase
MKISYPHGNWPAFIEDADLANLTDDEIQLVGQKVLECAVVVIKGPHNITIDQEVEFSKRFGKCVPYNRKPLDPNLDLEKFDRFWRADHRESEYIDSVTGKLNEDGLPGLHGMKEELGWHCGQVWNPYRTDAVSLYGVYGSAGSQTIYFNSANSYNDLSDEWKERIANLHVRPLRGYNLYSKTGEVFELDNSEVTTGYRPCVKNVNKAGITTIYLPFNQVAGFYELEDNPEEDQYVMNYLKEHMTQEKYLYRHQWEDGDYIIWDNWNGLHMRPPFAEMENRLLHRMQFNLDKINF